MRRCAPRWKRALCAAATACALRFAGAGLALAGCLEGPQKGTNLAGAEFAAQRLPGVQGTDYAYPTQADLAYFAATGMNLIRLPFRWERVQHEARGPLDAAEVAELTRVIDTARALHLCVLLDLHNYGTYYSKRIGSDALENSAFEDLWLRLAAAFPETGSTALGLMNEPAALGGAQWMALAQSTVLALRSAGAAHLIMVASPRWSGAHEWDKRFDGMSAADAFARFQDPAQRFVVELHQYTDGNFSGTGTACIAPERLRQTMQTVARWSAAHSVRFFMGEFGASDSPQCLSALRALLEPMQDSKVWLGWSYWAAGARWGAYPFSIHPGNKPEAAQLTLLREFLTAARGNSARSTP